jgi:hypothetical protein
MKLSIPIFASNSGGRTIRQTSKNNPDPELEFN